MEKRKLLSLILGIVLVITLSGCESKQSESSESTLTNGVAKQSISPTDMVEDTSLNDEFLAYVEENKLSSLIPVGCTMTAEH